jgi:glyoxylase-like metal-dependent hydrolase (beta-lactamase superfamily II)
VLNKAPWFVASLALALAGCGGTPSASSVIEDALATMGNPSSLQYSGPGMNGNFGQAVTAGQEWPLRQMSSFTRTVNYEQRSAQDELAFAQRVFGGQQQNRLVSGDSAWNVGPNGPVPQPAAASERQLHIWLTPHGFLKGAMAAGDATLSTTEGGNVVSFTALGMYGVEGTIDARNLVTSVRTTIPNTILGNTDTEVVANYSDYTDFDGVQFPGSILITQGGFPVWDLSITSVTPNAPLDLPVPEAVQGATTPPVQVTSNNLARGVWLVAGGSHHSVVVEFDEYLAIVEAPLDEARSLAVMGEARRLVPDKPVRYLLTTHHHFDHIGGMRTYAAEGATIVTHAFNVPYFEQILMAPATLMPDMQAKSMQAPMLQGVTDMYEITDGMQTIQVYATTGDTHTNVYTLIYLPGPRILVVADAYSAKPPDWPVPEIPSPNAVWLNEEIQRLNLDVATIAPLHGVGAVPIAELRRFIGEG